MTEPKKLVQYRLVNDMWGPDTAAVLGNYDMAQARRYFPFSTRILSQWATSRLLRTIRLLALLVSGLLMAVLHDQMAAL